MNEENCPAAKQENANDTEYVACVRAQVMCRDESTGGWLPVGGGGLSVVGLRQAPNRNYVILGQRLMDRQVVIKCVVKRDLEYSIGTPTFHHWRTAGSRFGLTFQNVQDANTFERAVATVKERLSQDVEVSDNVTDDDVFMTLDLPLDKLSPPSTKDIKPSCYGKGDTSPTHHHLHRLTFGRSSTDAPTKADLSSTSSYRGFGSGGSSLLSSRSPTNISGGRDPSVPVAAGNEYVELRKGSPVTTASVSASAGCGFVPSSAASVSSVHVYTLPLPPPQPPPQQQFLNNMSSVAAVRERAEQVMSQPPFSVALSSSSTGTTTTTTTGGRHEQQHGSWTKRSPVRCCHCHRLVDGDRRAKCPDAPDRCNRWVARATCVTCAADLLYYCCPEGGASAGGEAGSVGESNPCSCRGWRRCELACCRRWTLLSLLSLCLPCLWCWPLCHCLHRACAYCGLAGGHHRPVTNSP